MVWALLSATARADIALPMVNGQHYRPHSWDLPTQFQGRFFIPGQILFHNVTDQRYNAQGQRTSLGDTYRTTFGITALPVMFKLNDGDDWAYIAGIDILELKVSNSSGTLMSGVGNVLGDFTAWTKPDADSTVGFNVLLGTPLHVADDRLTRNKDLFLRSFYNRNLGAFNVAGALGYQHTYAAPASVGVVRDNYHVNLRFGRDFGVQTPIAARVTPFLGLDRMWTDGGVSSLTNASVGVHLAYADGTSWGVSKVRSLSGKNAPFADMWQFQVWTLF